MVHVLLVIPVVLTLLPPFVPTLILPPIAASVLLLMRHGGAAVSIVRACNRGVPLSVPMWVGAPLVAIPLAVAVSAPAPATVTAPCLLLLMIVVASYVPLLLATCRPVRCTRLARRLRELPPALGAVVGIATIPIPAPTISAHASIVSSSARGIWPVVSHTAVLLS